MFVRLLASIASLLLFLGGPVAVAHEGHDHDKPPPLNLPVAPRVISVTPEFELVGVASGKNRLTIFLHTFATNEPIKGARMSVSSGDNAAEAEPRGDGVFTLAADWLAIAGKQDLVFSITLSDGTQDLLTGEIQLLAAVESTATTTTKTAGWSLTRIASRPDLAMVGIGGLMAGVLLTLLVAGMRGRRRGAALATSGLTSSDIAADANPSKSEVTPLRRSLGAVASLAIVSLGVSVGLPSARAADAGTAGLPSVPPTMATDLAQRMPDGTLFVPKATQHLLSVRTQLTAPGTAPRSVELSGTIIAGPEHFGRVQPGRPGRIHAAPAGLAYIGKRVEKGQLLAYVQSYIEAADRANMDSLIAETEARIEKNRIILSRFEKSPGSVPQVRIDEIRGELDALRRKRAELLPSAGSREPILAPISGVVSLANATIGQIVEARDILFEIVDPSQFWVEAVAYDAKPVADVATAYANVDDKVRIPLEFAGRGLALRQQATVLTFRMPKSQEGLSIGMPVKVVLQSSARVDGFVLPASAIVRGPTGLPIVWVKTEPERFEPLTVKVEPLDGKSVVVTAGLKDALRVVTDGVTLLNQVR